MISSGETWLFQAMYCERRRVFGCNANDNTAVGGLLNARPYLTSPGFNLTNAIQVTFTP